MSTRRPPWSAQGQFAVTLLPPTRASNSVTARRPPGPGSAAALRAGSRDPCTPRPARRSGLAGLAPDRRRPRVSPGGPEPFGPRPASPAPTVSTSTTREEDRKASTDATTANPPARYGEAEKGL